MFKKCEIPDMRFLNRELPITEVTRELDLRLDGQKKIHCWHPERHQHGDRTASVGIRTSNNTVKCFGCDSKPMGPIDLVMDVRGMSLVDAALWIAARFDVPSIPARKRLANATRASWRVGHERGLELMIRSGIWARLSEAAQAIAPVMVNLSEKAEPHHEELSIQLSYRGIMRFSGIRSPNAVHNALLELKEWGLLRFAPEGMTPHSPARPTASYIITPNSNELWELAQAVARQMRDEIAAEKELRARLRKERIRFLKNNKEPQPPLMY